MVAIDVPAKPRPQPTLPVRGRRHRSRHPLAVRKAAMLTALVGLAHAILIVITVVLLKQRAPGVTATDAEISAFYSDPEKRRIVLFAGLYLIPFAGIAFIWFI